MQHRLRVVSGSFREYQNPAVHVLFDGTIYNDAELRRDFPVRGLTSARSNDAELIATLYARRGILGLHHIRGVFVVALADRDRDAFYLVRDRLGVMPLYYAKVGESVVFASQIASIFSASTLTPEINLHALRYFCFGVRKSPETIFRGILTVPPGHYLLMDRNGQAVSEYWDVRFPQDPPTRDRPVCDYVDALDALLTETVKLYMRGTDSRTAFLLSGGLDSCMMTSMASQWATLNTYTITFKGRYASYDESEFARAVAGHIGARHTEFEYKSKHVNAWFLETLLRSESPTYQSDISSTIPFYLMNKKLNEDGIKVVFSGAGSDEILGGYPHHKLEKIGRWYARRGPVPGSRGLYRRVTRRAGEDHDFFQRTYEEIVRLYGHNLGQLVWIKGFSYIRENLKNFLSGDVVDALGPDELVADLHLNIDPEKYCGFHPFDQSIYLDIKTRLVDFLLLEEHRMPRSFGVEARLPYLDHQVVEYVASIPPHVKMRGLNAKYALQKVAERHLPAEMFRHERRGFRAPFAREVLLDANSFLVNELLCDSALKRAGYLNHNFVRRLLEQYRNGQDHVEKAASYFLLERALIIQGIHLLFIERGWQASAAARLWRELKASLRTWVP